VYAGARLTTHSDDVARTLTFTVLVLSNLALIQANRSWGRTSWRAIGAANRHFGWISAVTLALLAAVLGIPAISRLFAFGPLTPALLLIGVGVALLSLLWFEGVKRGLAYAGRRQQ